MLKNIIKNPLALIILAFFLVFFAEYPALFLIKYGILNYSSIGFQIIDTLNAFTMMFIVPAIIINFFLKKPLSDFGLSVPVNIKQSILLTCLTILVFSPLIYFLSLQSNFQNFYITKTNALYFLTYSISGIFYYFAEEFIFRGFLHFGLWNRFKFHTIWIINIVFAIFHLNKPPLEFYFALLLGIALNYLSYKTKSFIPAVIVHFTLALILNILVTFIFI
ncbi:hypothetical protein A2356_02195 [Candidatus Nomurabacteria bacterium RIFOXYB1_FULL_39_16]|uniref:Abortive infection protein n=2 Tax=Candidatus Nomuraibacteriota TaxID=1752729 RepID=A0A0G0TYZ3_9BACT|nr:MAG: Abortive infection protein [Candidatus Nomurabacteria bacterium GW2011_GWF2_40_12]OGJ09970.1 MAG: hypothetical protein A2356_02195 [Candidatus Nomurabacteria bacterium RIFOXYB1_FULL_39_16]OGJ14141.1 MAG: hypothetical protein A2585_02070 [Candidatus Nomurabacteria bacterium RIFOXYD1_FULL_39_12]